MINLREFDVILGMDWSSKNHDIVGCQTNEVVMGIDGPLKTVFVGERRVASSCLISASDCISVDYRRVWCLFGKYEGYFRGESGSDRCCKWLENVQIFS